MDLVEHWFARREFVQYNMKYNGMTKMEAERYWILSRGTHSPVRVPPQSARAAVASEHANRALGGSSTPPGKPRLAGRAAAVASEGTETGDQQI